MDAFNIRARSPLRLGLAGGGTDLSPYCDRFGGAILNVTIDKYAHVFLRSIDGDRLVLKADDLGTEETLPLDEDFSINEGLVLHRAVYKCVMDRYCNGSRPPVSITTAIDVPAGSGLGASSSLVVTLIEAFRLALDLPLGPYDVAQLAFEIERQHLGLAGGRQDQYSAAFGGMNYMEFLAGDRVIVNPLRVSRQYLNEFESSLVICFTGQSRQSETIIRQQVSGLCELDDTTLQNMHKLKEDATEMKGALLSGQIRDMARILGRSWAAKKRTAAGVSSASVERTYDMAMAAGALAGKVSGAGGGGFMMLMVSPEHRYRLVKALTDVGALASGTKFTFDGAEAWHVNH